MELQHARAAAPATASPTVAAPATKIPRRTPERNSVSALAVSELLHATEEARVYVALGRPDRAIDVLNDHIKHVPRSLPAAWVMLLDLYHASNRPDDFRRLAAEFHLHCNVQAPAWENFGATGSDPGGLETFPHIQREVTRLWRQPGCREYLEGLLYDNREGRRIGFPLAAYSEILLLLQILDAPPPVDIDSDLVSDGKLEPLPKPAAASQPTASPARPAQAPRPPHPHEPPARPAQQPLDLGGNFDPAFARAKKA